MYSLESPKAILLSTYNYNYSIEDRNDGGLHNHPPPSTSDGLLGLISFNPYSARENSKIVTHDIFVNDFSEKMRLFISCE